MFLSEMFDSYSLTCVAAESDVVQDGEANCRGDQDDTNPEMLVLLHHREIVERLLYEDEPENKNKDECNFKI